MSLPKTILVPTDFGEASDAALDYATDLAVLLDAELVVMHAFEIPVVGFPDGAMVATAELTGRILEGAQSGLDGQLARARSRSANVRIRSIIKQGDPWRMVLSTTEDLGAGLVVMGTHGRKGLPRALIGSVAEKVVRASIVPVLTVHSGHAKRGAEQA